MADGRRGAGARPRESCARCCQLYQLAAINPIKGRIPLILPCGHTACDSCITSIVKRSEPLSCAICSTQVEYAVVDPKQAEDVVRRDYPVHTFLFGRLALELSQDPVLQSNFHQVVQTPDSYIDINAIIDSTGPNSQKCSECNNGTSYKCKQCDYIVCDTCFDRIHCFHPCMKKHTKENITVASSVAECPVHSSKTLDYYCENCKKTICMDCMLLGDKTCFSHNIISLKEKNVCNLDKLKAVTCEVDEIFRRLTKTALDMGKMLEMMNTDDDSKSEVAALGKSIRQHYGRLYSLLQVQEEDKLKEFEALKTSELKALLENKQAVASGLKASRVLLNKLKFAADTENIDKVNISALINEANEMKNTPWYLQKVENLDGKPLKFTVKPDVYEMLTDHLQLFGEAKIGYELLATKDIGEGVEIPPPPPRPLFPPEFVRDVREVEKKPLVKKSPHKKKEKKTEFSMDYPKFEPARSTSVSSLASTNSEHSQNPAYTQHKKQRPRNGYESPVMKNQSNIQTVTPYDTTPKTLEEGSRELVFVTHINSPSDFYVQRACLQARLKQMMAEFRKANSYEKPKMSELIEGFLLLTQCRLDSKWYRCRLVTIDHTEPNAPLYHVFYIDFGQTETVPYEKLRLLPMSQMRCEPAHALHCTLANCRPAKGAWSHDDNMLMHQIINNKQSLMYVRRSLGATNFGLALECDLTTWEDNVNVVKALVFHQRALFLDPQLEYPKLPQLNEKPKMFFSNDLKKGSMEEVLITHIVNPEKFYVRKSHLQSKYDKLCEEMEAMYKMHIKAGSVYCPEVGMVVAVNLDKYTEQVSNAGWRRGIILGLPGQCKVQVSLPDSGHEALVHWSALRRIQPKFTTMKALAMECYLTQITPISSKWSKGSVYLLEGHVNRPLQMYMTEEHRKKLALGVVLYDHSDPDNIVCINDEFIKCKYAIADGCFEFEHPNAPKIIPNKAPVEKAKTLSKRKPEVTIMKKEEVVVKKNINQTDLEVAADRGPPKLEVNILSCKSPSQIYITLVSAQDELNNLFDNLQTYYESTVTDSRDGWKEGDTCCVLSALSKTWRRAVIMQVDSVMAKVFYTDFAVVEDVPVTKLKILESGFTNIRDGAIKCHMSSIQPGGSTEWPSITCEHLRELLEQYTRFFITKRGEIKDKSLPVELWVYHMTARGALESHIGEWRRLNDNLIAQGLAIPDYSDGSVPDAVTSGAEFLNKVKGSMEEWLRLETAEKPSVVVHLPEDADVSSTCSNNNSPEPLTYMQWPKAEPPTNREFIGVPTYVSDDFYIYLYDVAQEDTLNIIRKTLDTCFMDTDPKPADMLWTVGQACIVKYPVDDHYYRGQVVEVLDDCKCKVMFVDYANVDIVPVIFMRKKIVMSQMPIQAIKCSLVGIQPVGGEWTSNYLTKVHRMIVEQKCFVRVVGDLDSEVLDIELKLHKQQNVNDLLVECGLAYHSDLPIPPDNPSPSNNTKGKEDTKIATSHDSDAEPDYIIEDDDSHGSDHNTGKVDWVKMLEEDEQSSDCTSHSEKYITYPQYVISTDDSGYIKCTVVWIDNLSTMQLSIKGIDDETEAFNQIVEEMQIEGASQPVIEGLYTFKACIALFSEDNCWYRAVVLEQDEGFVKVRYVDYGNSEIVPVANVREIKEDWCSIPARVVNAELHGIFTTKSADLKVIHQEYQKLFMNRELVAKVVQEKQHAVVVEIRKLKNEQLLYQPLIDSGLLVHTT